MTKNISVVFSAIALAAVVLFASATLTHASSSLFGGATAEPDDISLVSDLSNNPATTTDDYSGITFTDAAGIPYSSLTNLSSMYNVTDDDCGGGSPRFQIQIDTNGDTVSDGSVHVAFGPSPNFTNCAIGWQSTGNLIGNSDAGRYDYSAFGGSPFTTYSNMPASVASGTVRNISLVVDSGWSADASNGDSEQTVLIDNVMINNTTYDFNAATTSTVTIVKYVDGSHATASSSNSTTFPMQADYQASNLIGGAAGSDPYSIGPVGNNTPNAYEAKTVDLAHGASYATYEHTDTGLVGTACNGTSTPFRLVGYTWGDSLAEAASSTVATTSPSFTNLQSDKFVIVWNATCTGTTTPPVGTTTVQVHILKYLDGAKATAASSSNFMFPMTATWNASNLNGGATSSGSYVLGNNHGGAADQYGADTAAMNSPAYYSTSEETSTSSGMVLPIGAACETNKYKLLGYKTSAVSFADAANQPMATATPEFWSLNTDRYVIVYNQTCNGSQTPPPTTSGCAATSTLAGYTRVNGTVGNDKVTLQPNTFYVGMGGNDKVTAGDGNYIICTGPGNDTIKIGNGNAQIDAGGGNNTITTGNGTHTITTASGNDTITTGNGVDAINAGGGNNTVKTGAGNDSVTTGSGNDKIDAGVGSGDSCSPGGGNNQVTNCEL